LGKIKKKWHSLPGIYCGIRRPTNANRKVKVTCSDLVKSELRNSERRAANNIENVFLKTKKIQMKTLVDQSQVAIRKVKIG
jgi:gluconate kinase